MNRKNMLGIRIKWVLVALCSFAVVWAFNIVAPSYAEDIQEMPEMSFAEKSVSKGDVISFGTLRANNDRIPWLVLGEANDGDDNSKLLITKNVIESIIFWTDGSYDTWEKSNAKKWCGEFLENNFSDIEKSDEVIKKTNKIDEDNTQIGWLAAPLVNEQVFFLSVEEALDNNYFDSDNSRIAYPYDNEQSAEWWLRTPYKGLRNTAWYIMTKGSNHFKLQNQEVHTRPAFNLNMDSVVLATNIESNLKAGNAGSTLSKVNKSAAQEKKLTLIDENHQNFSVDSIQIEDNLVTINYSGAQTGMNEYVSGFIVNENGDIAYYGKLGQVNSHSGSVSLDITDEINEGDTLYIINEQINGSMETDCSSTPYMVSFGGVQFQSQGGSDVSPQIIAAGGKATEPVPPTRAGYKFGGWFSDEEMESQFDFESPVSSYITLYAKWYKDIYVDQTTDNSGTVIKGNLRITDRATGEIIKRELDGGITPTNYGNPISDLVEDKENQMKADLRELANTLSGQSSLSVKKETVSTAERISDWDDRKITTSLESKVDDEQHPYIERTYLISGEYGIKWTITITLEAEIGDEKDVTDITNADVTLSNTNFLFNGKVQKPTIVKIAGRTLKEGVDYTANWSSESSSNVGTYTIIVTGIDNYCGTTKAVYKINKGTNTMTVKPVKKTVKVKKLKKKALKVSPLKVTNAKGTVTYKITGGNKKSKMALKINAKTGKITVKKKTKKGTYKVRVTVKAAGTTEYKPVSKTVTITVKAK